jgi:hypothetical protein
MYDEIFAFLLDDEEAGSGCSLSSDIANYSTGKNPSSEKNFHTHTHAFTLSHAPKLRFT